ncbi:MAG: hypothetical protein GY854_33385 [Deltaproteobacteria bacterium]|nr:hypothetical protein [Deltaproteobacteria bacterium]
MKIGRALVTVIVFSSLVAGCGKRYIPNTEIEDNEVNREIVAFCERYRHAVEDLNIGLLLSLASPRYFDNSGTTTGDDDMDRVGLEDILKNRFKTVRAIRYEIHYRSIYENYDVIHIEYTYTTSFQYEVDGVTKWENKTADNQLELERIDDGYLILSGM